MRGIKGLYLTALFLMFLSASAYAFGGAPPEENTNIITISTPEAVSAEVQPVIKPTTEAMPSDEQKATMEIIKLEAEKERVNEYIDSLNKKIMKARAAKDDKKVNSLKATQRIVIERETQLAIRINSIRQAYPNLKESTPESPITAKEKPSAAAGPTPNIVYHEVQMGDTLMNVSRKYFDTPVYYKEIAKLNGIVDMSYLPQGTRLMIDLNIAKSASSSPAPAPVVSAAPVSEGQIVYHTVAAGETLMSISRQYFGTPSMFREIARINGITELGQLRIGMKLKIDKSMKVPPPTVPSL